MAFVRPALIRLIAPAERKSRSAAVNRRRILEHWLDRPPGSVLKPLKETAVPARMTRHAAALFDYEQDCVVVAVQPDLADALHVPRLLALAPEPPARARPVVRFPACCSAFKRLAIHPGLRQHVSGARLLCDRRHEAVGVPADLIQPHIGQALSVCLDSTLEARAQRISIPAAAIARLASPTVNSP